MKRFLLSLLLFVGAASAALAQINTVPQTGVITNVGNSIFKATYSSATVALPPAASATDIACIAGSASKTIKVLEIRASGSAATLITAPVYLALRTAVNTAGTAATTTANWANNVAKNDTNNPTHAATLISYAANPTITDSAPKYVRAGNLTVPVTSAGTSTVPLVWRFGDPITGEQPLTLRGAAAQACLNLGGTTIDTGLLSLSITWTEE